MESYKHLRKQLLKNKEFRKAYTALGPEFSLIQMLIEKRTQKGLTQAELARRMKTKQSAIARLESGNYNPTLEFLGKAAKALDAQLKVSII